jgi:hypothetical protein
MLARLEFGNSPFQNTSMQYYISFPVRQTLGSGLLVMEYILNVSKNIRTLFEGLS